MDESTQDIYDSDIESNDIIDDLDDDDYCSNTESEYATETESESEETVDLAGSLYNDINNDSNFASELKQRKFIVYENNLLELMTFCMKCGEPIVDEIAPYVKGASVSYTLSCHGGCKYTWNSQPASGSLLITSAIISTGNTYGKLSSFSKALNLNFIGKSTFFKNQETIMPIVQDTWEEERAKVVDEMKGKDNLILAGDARCDSVGYNAKYGSYTLMDTTGTTEEGGRKKIVSTELIQVSEVASSNHMEVEGLKRCLTQIKDDDLNLKTLTTDRHIMVASLMKKDGYNHISHQFDIWHFVKNIMKKLMTKAKLKKCQELMAWVRSITNHLWWCAQTCKGNAQLLREKWLSVFNHIINVHSWAGYTQFHKCAHSELSREEVAETAWLNPNSEAFKALQTIVTDTRTNNALPYLTQFCHTGELEVFHSSLLKYCPKKSHFMYNSMKTRLYIAALDWNTQTRTTARDNDGKIKEKLVYCKRNKQWVKRVQYKIKSGNHISPFLQKIMHCHLSVLYSTEANAVMRKSRFAK